MSFGRKDSDKDIVYFITKEDLKEADSSTQEPDNGNEGAYNPKTGEINWDCPCLGGMAHGPCGEQFKTAFSCFVFSEADPKGADCVGFFKKMQNCFQDFPEYYADQLANDDQNNSKNNTSRSSSVGDQVEAATQAV